VRFISALALRFDGFSLTPRFSEVESAVVMQPNRFSGFQKVNQTAKAVANLVTGWHPAKAGC